MPSSFRRAVVGLLAAFACSVPLSLTVAHPAAAATVQDPVLFGLSDHWYPDYETDDRQLGTTQGIYGTFFNWSSVAPSSGVNFFSWARGHGGMPMMAFDPPAGTALPQITRGDFDAKITAWSRATSTYGHPVLVRLFAEMNTTSHDYALNKHPGNTPSAFRAAYQHVVDVWHRSDPARMGRFVFNPNRVYAGEPSLDNYWPGATYVDWLAMDAYNWWDGSLETRTVRGALEPTAKALRALPGAAGIPMFVAEIGAPQNSARPQWISQIPAATKVLGQRAIVWWDESATRLDTDSASLQASRTMIATAPIVHPGAATLAFIDRMAMLPKDAIEAYYWTHGADSTMGVPTATTQALRYGKSRAYTRGSIYWSPTTGGHAVVGAIRTRYLTIGGPSSTLGLPVTDEYSVQGGRQSDFQHGSIRWTASTGAVAVTPR